jgi:SOS regulatory protein LexA
MPIDPSYLPKLRDYYAKHHVIPSYAAMGKLWGIAAKSWVANCVGRLKEEGYLKVAPDKRLGPGRRFFERPLASSKVAVGFPSPATEDLHNTITIDEYLVRHPSQTVLVTVKGDSMIDAGIHPGDVVVVEKRNAAQPGEIVVAIIETEFTVKTLAKEGGRFVLKPANKAYPVLRPKELEIFGVVVASFRKYR